MTRTWMILIAVAALLWHVPAAADWDPGDPHKWLQRPDLTTMGIDVNATGGTAEPGYILADDFKCTVTGPITGIHLWGSWWHDELPNNNPRNVVFTLSFHGDIPDSESSTGYSMPGDVLWYRTFQPTEFTVRTWAGDINEGWMNPPQDYEFPGDHVCYQYNFSIDPDEAFVQLGTEDQPVVYWLDVQARPLDEQKKWGWKTSINHWNDDAVWGQGSEPYPGPWYELVYPPSHEMHGESIDLAFVIVGEEQPQELDFGDAPESMSAGGYPTTLAMNGARHIIGGPWLGDTTDNPDPEPDGQPDPDAKGDDVNDGNDDEDGVLIPPLTVGQPATITMEVNGGGGVVEAWLDFNGSWTWEATEMIFSGWLPDGDHSFNVTPPSSSVIGQTFARFRISANGGLSWEGEAPDGEVEDHEVFIHPEPEELDFGDAPLSPLGGGYPTTLALNGARHIIAGPWFGDDNDGPDAEADGQPDPDALGDDNNWSDDEDGVSIPVMTVGQMATITFEVNGGGGMVAAWVDWDGSYSWEAGEQIVAGWHADGMYLVNVVPPGPYVGQTFARFRITGATGVILGPEGLADDGEVEDHEVWIEEQQPELDFGDAPQIPGGPGYPTTLALNGARHVLPGPWLGDANDVPDPEPDGQPDPNALGDDNDGNDDEDGVQIPTLYQGQVATIALEVNGGGGTVVGWIDFDYSYSWEAAEQVYFGWLPDGMHAFNITVPVTPNVGQTFARFRIFSGSAMLPPVGPAPDGEVEDHEVWIRQEVEWDFGDAPETPGAAGYPTTLALNGARHRIVTGGPYFDDPGGGIPDNPDPEPDGQPDPNALGDDTWDLNDDEDGVQIPILIQGIADNITVGVGPGGGFVEAWIDFNGDLVWQGVEMIFGGWLPGGVHAVPVTAPVGSIVGQTFARFRISANGGLPPVGPATEGEVEDHEVWIEEQQAYKWLQRPDLSIYGIDVNATHPYILADDFLCTEPSYITEIVIWGSWVNDYVPFGMDPAAVMFTLSFHEDIPDSMSPTEYSMPGDVKWFRHFVPGDFDVRVWQDGIYEGWMNPPDDYWFPADTVCWLYKFTIPQPGAFRQEGTEERPIVYWLDVQAYPEDPEAFFGWKTSREHWNDDAVWGEGMEPYPGPWGELRYPPNHELYGQSIDLAFLLRAIPVTDVPGETGIGTGFGLHQNVPNPFNPVTEILYDIPATGRVSLEVFDVQGHLVRTLVDAVETGGSHAATWDGRDEFGREVPTGVYFYRLEAGGLEATRKMLLLK